MSCFVGFGSLVNTSTHIYKAEAPVRVLGWSRAWINNDTYDHAFLSVIPRSDVSIYGLLARVPDGNWDELDVREAGYRRRKLDSSEWLVESGVAPLVGETELNRDDVQMYVHSSGAFASSDKPILYSYLETVLFGFYKVFGEAGVRNFIETTTAWTAIKDDRSLPLYPRHVPPIGAAATVVEHAITGLEKISN